MPSRGQACTLTYVAWDTGANAGKAADATNHTLRWVKNGTPAAPTNSPVEVDGTNAPGVYKLDLTAAEGTCDVGTLAGKSATAGVVIIPATLAFEQLPTAVPGTTGGLPTRGGAIPDATAGAAGGLPILGTGAGAINPSGGKVPATLAAADVSGNVAADLQTIKTQAVTAAAGVTFPAAIGTSTYAGGAVASVTGNVGGNVAGSVASVTADVGITQAAADKVWGSAARTLTAFGFSVAVGTGGITAASFAAGAIDAAAIATDALGSLELAAGAAAEIAAAVWGSTVRTLTTFAFDVTVGGYATGQDPGTLLDGRLDALDAGQATIAGSVAAVVDAVWAKAMTELSAVPGVNATTLEALQWLFVLARNRYEATPSTQTLRNDADSADIATSAISDVDSLFTRGKWS